MTYSNKVFESFILNYGTECKIARSRLIFEFTLCFSSIYDMLKSMDEI